MRYAYGLVPLGFSMWLAHYGFHFFTGALTVVPVTQSAAIDVLGWAALGDPLWRWVGMRPGAVFPLQLGCILLGTAGSLAVMHLISLSRLSRSVSWCHRALGRRRGPPGSDGDLDPVPADGDARDWIGRMRLRAGGPLIVWGTILSVLFANGSASAHAGPPFPIVSSRTAGPYDVLGVDRSR